MNCYILPKHNNIPVISPCFTRDISISPYISHSLMHYLILANENLTHIYEHTDIHTIEMINMMINTYEFIFSNVPNSILSVSKMNPTSNLFYELMEIFNFCNIQEYFVTKNTINTCHFTPYFHSSIYLLNLFRELHADEDINMGYDFEMNNIKEFIETSKFVSKLDFLYFEFKSYDYKVKSIYFKNMIVVLRLILKYQNINGITIIKIDAIFYKLIVDIIFILSALFETVYIIKPQVSNIKTNERFLVCKNFELVDESVLEKMEQKLSQTISSLNRGVTSMVLNVDSLIYNTPLPYYFINKIEEINIILGKQQFEIYDQIISIIKNKNRDDKIETLKRNNIQKCILWCEKYKIPHNKFIDKTNIFLNARIVKDVDVSNENK